MFLSLKLLSLLPTARSRIALALVRPPTFEIFKLIISADLSEMIRHNTPKLFIIIIIIIIIVIILFLLIIIIYLLFIIIIIVIINCLFLFIIIVNI